LLGARPPFSTCRAVSRAAYAAEAAAAAAAAAGNMANETAPAKDGLQEEERLQDAIEHLKELHLQLRHLRSVLPRMFEPLNSKPPSPQVFLTAFSQSIQKTGQEITGFKEAYTSDESKQAFQRAAESRRKNPSGIKPWRPRDDPDWTTVNKRQKKEHPAKAAETR